MNNFFLTGNKQVGKSTIINKLIQELKLPNNQICGFKTVLETEKQRTFYLEPINYIQAFEQKLPICQNQNNHLVGVVETFNTLGVQILDSCLDNQPRLIMMDELGTFENDAVFFQERVLKCLDSDIPVLGVLKAKSSLFLDTIKARNDTSIFHITKENRDEQQNKILTHLIYSGCQYSI